MSTKFEAGAKEILEKVTRQDAKVQRVFGLKFLGVLA
jgi:hypothetical protein